MVANPAEVGKPISWTLTKSAAEIIEGGVTTFDQVRIALAKSSRNLDKIALGTETKNYDKILNDLGAPPPAERFAGQ